MMAAGEWIATPEKVLSRWCVVERVEGRTTRIVADDLSEEEAHLIAASGKVATSLEELLNVALEEGEYPSDEVRQKAMRAFLSSKGLA